MLLSVSGLQRDRRIGSHPRRGVKGKKKEKAKRLTCLDIHERRRHCAHHRMTCHTRNI